MKHVVFNQKCKNSTAERLWSHSKSSESKTLDCPNMALTVKQEGPEGPGSLT